MFLFWKIKFICIKQKKIYRWIRIISSKIKHKQNNFLKKLLSKKGMQNMWSNSWDWDRPIEKKIKLITKSISKKKLMQNNKIVKENEQKKIKWH